MPSKPTPHRPTRFRLMLKQFLRDPGLGIFVLSCLTLLIMGLLLTIFLGIIGQVFDVFELRNSFPVIKSFQIILLVAGISLFTSMLIKANDGITRFFLRLVIAAGLILPTQDVVRLA